MAILDDWIDDLPQQFQGKENIEILLSAFARQLEEISDVFQQLDEETDLDTAIGKNLDMVGDIVVLTRKEASYILRSVNTQMSDSLYRQTLRYKIAQNNTNCTYYDIMDAMSLLWDTENISYYEDPDRPATICMLFPTTSIDAADPAVGRILSIKPSGVALKYLITYVIELIMSTLETIEVPYINIFTRIPFWSGQLLDGSILLDGSQLLNAVRSYNARVGLVYDYGDVETDQTANLVKVAILAAVRTAETAELGREMKITTSIDFWQSIYLDGSYLLDGSATLEYERQYNTAAVAIAAGIQTSEDSAASLTTSRNLHYCDGSVVLDGSTLLNSFIEKEEI